MSEDLRYRVALFQSVSVAMKAESVLKAAGAPYKIIPVPKAISSECGICVRFSVSDNDQVTGLLSEAGIRCEIKDL